MVSIILSVVIKMHFQKESIYTLKLKRKGLKLKKEFEPNILSNIKIGGIYKTNCLKVQSDTTFEELSKLVKEKINLNYFVVDKEDSLMGILSPYKIRNMSIKDKTDYKDKKAIDLILEYNIYFTPEDTLDMVGLNLNNIILDEIPVVNNETERKVIGYISKTEVIHAYNNEVIKKTCYNRFQVISQLPIDSKH